MQDEVENWLKISNYDLRSSESSFKEGFYSKVVENCHSSIEKLIKGIVVEHKNEEPPKIHSLLKLVSLTLIENLADGIKTVLAELDSVYISTRYPDNFDYINELISKEKAKEILDKSKELHKWFLKKIK